MKMDLDLKVCLASLKSAHASLEQFALSTQDQTTKKIYMEAAHSTKQVIQQLEARVKELQH